MNIGPLRIAHPFTLAPLEEHSNYPFRRLMRRFGASLVVTERVDAAGVARRQRRAMRLLYTTPGRVPPDGPAQRRPTRPSWPRPPAWWPNWASTWSI